MSEYKNKIENLVKSYDKLNDLEFRLLLEELLKRGKQEAETEYAIILKNREFTLGVRLNLIRVAGYVKSPLFLIPLKNIIDTEKNINLRKEAIIAIAKYNDKKALNILSDSLKKNSDKTLENIIKQEIGKIKKDNPVLSLIPQFLKSTNNKKAYNTIINVLCKIVTTSDAKTFIPFLNSEDRYVAEGSFKILCYTGDKSISGFIFNFFEKIIGNIDCITKIKCDRLYEIIIILQQYIFNNPQAFELFYSKIKELYEQITDIRVKEQIILILISGNKNRDISLIFNKEKDLRGFIIENYKNIEEGVDFLIDKLKNNSDYVESIINVLITTEKGKKYLADNYKEFDNKERIIILNNLNFDNYDYFRFLVKDSILSENPIIAKTALTKIKENYDYSMKDSLFDIKNKEKFKSFEELYIDTIISLFPLEAFLFLIHIIKNEGMTLKKLRKYIKKLGVLLSKKPIVKISKDNKNSIIEFLDIILRTNNSTLLIEFITDFNNIGVIEPESFLVLNELIEYYIGKRKSKYKTEEKKELKKFFNNLKTNKELIDKINQGELKLRLFFQSHGIDINLLENIAKNYKLSFFTYRDKIIDKLKKTLLSNDYDTINKVLLFLDKFPKLGFLLKEEILNLQKTDSYSIKANSKELLNLIPTKLKIIIRFSERERFPIFRDQLKIIFNEFEITNEGIPDKNTIFITDSRFLINNEEFKSIKVKPVIILNRLSDGAFIKRYGGITFLPEYSLYRVIVEIIKEIW
jgi:hypothetical protein